MDSTRFDRLSRHVGKQTDRRRMFKAAAGGALAALGVHAIDREAAAVFVGFEDDDCTTSADCQGGLVCRGGGGFLATLIASGLYGPPSAAGLFPTGTGSCRYQAGCGKQGDACRRTDNCCSGLSCNNNHCR